MLTLIGIAIFSLYLPLVVLSGRSSEEDRKMRARFAALKVGRAHGLSPGGDVDLLKDVEEGAAGVLQVVVRRLSETLELETVLLQADSQRTPRAVLQLCAVTAAGSALVALLVAHNIPSAACAGVAGGFPPFLLLKAKARKRTAAMDRLLPEISDMISRALRAGHSISAALGIVAEEAPEPARTAFGGVFQKQKFGFPLRDALLDLVRCFPSEDLKVLVTAILVQRETGGNLVQVLERTSAVIRERQKLQGDVRVHTAQGRLTGWILCMLPVLMLVVLTLTNPSYPKVLIDDPLGRKLLLGGVVLLAFGGFLIQRIVKGIEV